MADYDIPPGSRVTDSNRSGAEPEKCPKCVAPMRELQDVARLDEGAWGSHEVGGKFCLERQLFAMTAERDIALRDYAHRGEQIVTLRQERDAERAGREKAEATSGWYKGHNEALLVSLEQRNRDMTELTASRGEYITRALKAEAEVKRLNTSYDTACKTIADMHAAAIGKVAGPIRGVVEDVADLRAKVEGLTTALRDIENCIRTCRVRFSGQSITERCYELAQAALAAKERGQ